MTEEEFLQKINRILLLRLKTLILKNLKKEDVPDFEKAVLTNDSNVVLDFANKKIPSLALKITEEVEKVYAELKEIKS